MAKTHDSWGYFATKWSYPNIDRIPPELRGVYIIWCPKTKACIYVGQAKDQPIRERLLQHWSGSHNETLKLWIKAFGKYLDVCFKPCATNRIDTLERRLIKAWKPQANRQLNPNKKYMRA